MIYISSTAFTKHSFEEIIHIAESNGINIEFSSNLPFHPKAYQLVIEAKINRLTHNYFPAPETPYVLNLASLNDEIREQSVNHCLKALEIAKKISAPFFAAHAGYCLDPDPNELGRSLKKEMGGTRENYWEAFIESVIKVERKAKELDVLFLIENNVLTSENYYSYNKINPLLCCDPDEIAKLYSEVPSSYVGMLLDTAHLKVSSRTLNFDLGSSVDSIKPFIKAIHHSDNDGNVDSNGKLDENYWFGKFMSEFDELDHVVEVKNLSLGEIRNQKEILYKFLETE
ncbi:MAG: TIM barrel protein [Balneolaceae bacterium]